MRQSAHWFPSLAVALLLLTPAWRTAAGGLTICADGKSDYVIVSEGHSLKTFANLRGASEIQSCIAQMTGVQLPIILPAGKIPEHAIIVGENPFTQSLGVQFNDKLGDDGFVEKTIGNRIVLAGPGKRGSLYACYDFLEQLGVRWFTTTITRIPHRPTLTIDELNETQIPSFEYREPYFTEALEPNWCAHLRCNSSWAPLDAGYGGRMRYSPYFVHTMHRIIPVNYYDTHPEYFAMVDGKRVRGNRDAQRCLSNPDVLQITIDTVSRWIDDNPDGMIFSVSQNDTQKYCTCDDCKALIKKYGGVSGEYVWFVNQVAEAIEKKHPNVIIDTLAYQFTEAPPTPGGVKPRANVRIRLCPIRVCEAHPYEQCTSETSRAFMKNFQGWLALTNNLYVWQYCADFHNQLMPFPDFRQFPDSIRFYQRNGVKGVFLEGACDPGGGGSDAELRAYVMAKLLWNTRVDENQLINEWMTGVYGAQAAKPMRQWFDLVHDQVKDPNQHLFVYDPVKPEIFSPPVIARGDELLKQAADLTAADPAASRYVKKAQLDLRYVKLALHPTKGPELQKFIDDARGFEITYFREQWPLQKWLSEYMKQFDTQPTATKP